ncbi:coiled-coil domain-containing protein 40 isoform X2 [Archocentrus centrarchus]|uniref:coiled-coil domain-containing protein 40 isoform X2 n=1 Tax=Archocentrus centrarchus TaxID=63155 RepID=UPI0011E9C2BB|nr:coiled-coil domain-containing protein 40 isoform X2 [Archocentrus centrarchus]
MPPTDVYGCLVTLINCAVDATMDMQDQSPPQPDDSVSQPHPDLSIVDESPPAATDSDVAQAAELLHTSEEMEDQEPRPEDEEKELIVLDPEHPLVRRQQAELNIQLRKRLESLKQTLREKREIEKANASHMQSLGLEVYQVQERLAGLQNKLDNRRQTKTQAEAKQQQSLQQLEEMKSKHSSMASKLCKAKASVSQLQVQLDNLTQQLVFIQGVSEGLRSEVKTTEKARHKARAEKTQAEDQKLKQDLYVDRLTKELDRLTQQIAMYEAQTRAQAEKTQTAKDALSEVEVVMESLSVSRKQLLQQWDSSLTGLRRRDEALSAKQEALREAKHQVILLDKEIDGYKKSITAEQEKNEVLTMQLNWAQTDCTTSRKLISEKQAQREALQARYSTCLLTLQETERTLATLSQELDSHQAQVNDQRRQLEKESSVRLELENNIMTCMQQKLLHNNAAKHSQRLATETATLKREKTYQLKQLEDEVLTVKLESQQISQQADSLGLTREALDQEIEKSNMILTASQAKAAAFVRLIDQKQLTINNYRKMISQIAASTGHDDLSPQQIKIQSVIDQIEELAANIKRDQQLWMKQQETLMGLTRTLEANSREMLKLQTEYTGQQQAKIYMESKIESEHSEQAELEKNSKTIKHDLLKLNKLLSEKGHLSQALEQENALMETDFLHRLKDAEREAVKMQMNIEKMQEEKEKLLNSLVEAERQIMLWEKKMKLVKELHSAVDVGQEEIHRMKAEIHRMEVRLSQLMKQQEQLLRESEATVVRREAIVLRKEAMAKKSQQATKAELSLSIRGLQRKIRETHKQVAEYKQEIDELQNQKERLSDEIGQKKSQLTDLCGTACILDSDIVNLQDTKERNLAHLVYLQRRAKRLQGVCEGSYQALSTPESVGAALQSQMERVHAVLHRECEALPQHQEALRRLSRALAAQEAP